MPALLLRQNRQTHNELRPANDSQLFSDTPSSPLVLRVQRAFSFFLPRAPYPPTALPPKFLLSPQSCVPFRITSFRFPQASTTTPRSWGFFSLTPYCTRVTILHVRPVRPRILSAFQGKLTSACELVGRWGSAQWPSCRAPRCSASILFVRRAATGCELIMFRPNTALPVANPCAMCLRRSLSARDSVHAPSRRARPFARASFNSQ